MVRGVRALSQDDAHDRAPGSGGRSGFPDGFLWGAATSAFQVEGATESRGRSIWDTFCETPRAIRDGGTGEIAADHVRRMPQDVALMRELGHRAYRFSISWPRVVPDGTGAVSEAGLDVYRRLVDALLDVGITPFVTLYHWDLPQPLQDMGGWPNRQVVDHFVAYAERVFTALGDRVGHWATINEPWCAAFLGYGEGRHAPGERDQQRAVRAAHHLLVAHGMAIRAMRASGPADRQMGIVLNPAPVRAASDAESDVDAARRLDGVLNRLFLEPLLDASYPEDVMADFAESVDLSHVLAGDAEIIGEPIDLLGVNYYRPFLVAGGPGDRDPNAAAWPGADRIIEVARHRPRTAMGWEIEPGGLTELLVDIHRRYPHVPLFVTENGAAFDDQLPGAGAADPHGNDRIEDPDRVDYLRGHIAAARRAIAGGADLRGYFVWSLMDNFEWAEGYSRRFGLVYVDYPTQRRIPKRSAVWYRDVIEANGSEAALEERASAWR
jgi:beta-glucosidase